MQPSELIRTVRRRRGLTQAALARAAGTSQPVISAYEAGRRDPTYGTLRKIIAAAGEELLLSSEPLASKLPPPVDLAGHARRLLDVLSLADAIPVRPPAAPLRAPRLVSRQMPLDPPATGGARFVDMTPQLTHLTFDCADAEKLATFWSAVLDEPIGDDPSPEYAVLTGQPGWMFVQVPEPKSGKNRVHPDLTTTDLEAEVARLLALGATHLADHTEAGTTWATLADPEGNEFDVAAG